ncbi:hypothetical protein KDA00_02355 [Candidatus Saccharibacteria bacterium]|nr:hypothetical protein [Candidatus Saccharibacteria bacterium]
MKRAKKLTIGFGVAFIVSIAAMLTLLLPAYACVGKNPAPASCTENNLNSSKKYIQILGYISAASFYGFLGSGAYYFVKKRKK